MTLLSRQERPPGPHSWAGNKLNQMYPDFAGGPISRRNEAIGASRIEQERDCLQVVGPDGDDRRYASRRGGCPTAKELVGT